MDDDGEIALPSPEDEDPGLCTFPPACEQLAPYCEQAASSFACLLHANMDVARVSYAET